MPSLASFPGPIPSVSMLHTERIRERGDKAGLACVLECASSLCNNRIMDLWFYRFGGPLVVCLELFLPME